MLAQQKITGVRNAFIFVRLCGTNTAWSATLVIWSPKNPHLFIQPNPSSRLTHCGMNFCWILMGKSNITETGIPFSY
jgi:hypothetical protein